MNIIDNAIASHSVFGDLQRMHEIFSEIRREDPLHWTEAEGNPGFWAVTKHADVVEIGRNNELFINAPMVFLRDNEEERVARADNGGRGNYARTLVNMDEPEHRLYRGLTQAWFMPANIKRLDGLIVEQASKLVDKMMTADGSCEFVNDIAIWYPLRVIMTLLGVHEDDHPLQLKLAQQLLAPKDPHMRRAETNGESAKAGVVKEFFSYFSNVFDDRRTRPREDLSTVIAQSIVEGEPIGGMEALSYFLILATAGHDTTANSLAGGLHALISNPDELAKLRGRIELMPGAVEEIFRWVSPVRHFMRTATADYQLRGKTIRKGDLVMLCYPSANRDEEVFVDSQSFRVDRTPNRHVAFGFGPHACLGQNLARSELKAFLCEMLARIDHIELAGNVEWVQSNQVSGPKALPIRYSFAAR